MKFNKMVIYQAQCGVFIDSLTNGGLCYRNHSLDLNS